MTVVEIRTRIVVLRQRAIDRLVSLKAINSQYVSDQEMDLAELDLLNAQLDLVRETGKNP